MPCLLRRHNTYRVAVTWPQRLQAQLVIGECTSHAGGHRHIPMRPHSAAVVRNCLLLAVTHLDMRGSWFMAVYLMHPGQNWDAAVPDDDEEDAPAMRGGTIHAEMQVPSFSVTLGSKGLRPRH